MARAVYSTLFYGGVISSSTGTAGPVPAGVVWVVRDVCMVNYGLWPEPLVGAGVLDQHNYPVLWVGAPHAIPQTMFHWDGRQVFEPGDTIRAVAEDAAWAFRVSGYVLTLP